MSTSRASKHPNFKQNMGVTWWARWHRIKPDGKPAGAFRGPETLCGNYVFTYRDLPLHIRQQLDAGEELPTCRRCEAIHKKGASDAQ